MKSNRSKISKFMAAITLASGAISSFNGCVSGMESEDKLQQEKIDKLSQEIVKLIKTSEEFRSFDSILRLLGIAIFHTSYYDPNIAYPPLYEPGISVEKFLYNIKAWMKSTDMKVEEERVQKEKGIITKWYKKYGQKTMNANIDFIFEQVLKNVSKEISPGDDALFDFVGNVRKQIQKKWRKNLANKLSKDYLGENCIVCFGKTSEDDICLDRCCGHYMHKGCLQKWVLRDPHCPICKTPLERDWVKNRLDIEI